MPHPEWTKGIKRPVKEQITIVIAGNRRPPVPLTRGSVNMADTGDEETGASRMYGAGADGVVQPLKRAGDVHENEFVFDAETTQALGGPELLQALSDKAQSGKIDVNALRKVVGIDQKPGYAWGGLVKDPLNPAARKAAEETGKANAAARSSIPVAVPAVVPTVVPTVTPPTVRQPVVNPISMAPTVAVAPPQPIAEPQKPMSAAELAQRTAMRQTQDIAEGKSEAARKIAASQVGRYDRGAAVNIQAARQDIASAADMPESTALSMVGQAQSGARAGRSELLAKLADTAQQNAQAATGAAFTMGTGLRSQEAQEKETARQTALQTIETLTKAGIGQNLPALIEAYKQAGININPEALQTADAQTKFQSGMDLITRGIASGMTNDQIEAALRTNGIDPSIFGTTGAGGGFGGVANSLRGAANTIDTQIRAIDESTTLTPEQKARMKAYLQYTLTGGDLGLEVVKDPETGEYKVQEKGTSGTITGQGGVTITQPPGIGKGGAFIGQDNNLYVVNDAGQTEPIKPENISFIQLKANKDNPAFLEKVKSSMGTNSAKEIWGAADSGSVSKRTLNLLDITGKSELVQFVEKLRDGIKVRRPDGSEFYADLNGQQVERGAISVD